MEGITVHLDVYASEEEEREIQRAFSELGLGDVEVRRDYERKAGADGQLPWMVVIAMTSLSAYLGQLSMRAADDTYPFLKKGVGHALQLLVGAIRDARNRRYGMEIPGSILLQDGVMGVTVVIGQGLPDAAYYALSQIQLSGLSGQVLYYDSVSGGWTAS